MSRVRSPRDSGSSAAPKSLSHAGRAQFGLETPINSESTSMRLASAIRVMNAVWDWTMRAMEPISAAMPRGSPKPGSRRRHSASLPCRVASRPYSRTEKTQLQHPLNRDEETSEARKANGDSENVVTTQR